MRTRLTKKKRNALLKQIDEIIMQHRVRIYQQLTPTIGQTNADAVQDILGDMNAQLIREVNAQFNQLLTA